MFYIIRHGQTEGNKNNALQGRSNLPLNLTGRQQAEQLRSFFNEKGISFDWIYSSPLTRAVETAELASGSQCEIQLDDRLLEMDYGPYEGTSLEHLPPEITTFFSDFVHNPAPEGMEPLFSVVNRMGLFLKSIAETSSGNILISTHAIAMKGALEYLTPDSNGAYWSKYIANCCVYSFDYIDGSFTIPKQIS